MRKILVLMLCAWILQSCGMCKYFSGTEDIALVAGVGASSITGEESWSPKVGGQIGAETKLFKFNENSSVSSGLAVTFQGAAWGEDTYSGKLNLSYINIPVLYTYESNGGFYGQAGLQPGLLMTAKDKYEGGSQNYRDYLKWYDLGLLIGAGYKINDKINVGARAGFGLPNLSKTDSNARNYLAAVLITYDFGSPFDKDLGQ